MSTIHGVPVAVLAATATQNVSGATGECPR